MPDRLYRLLEDEEKHHLESAPPAISDILYKLLEQDQHLETAFLCHSAVRYIGKIRVRGKDEENSFCGYHNIQMLISYVHAVNLLNGEVFKGGMASIWEIQDLVDRAWDRGFNAAGRVINATNL